METGSLKKWSKTLVENWFDTLAKSLGGKIALWLAAPSLLVWVTTQISAVNSLITQIPSLYLFICCILLLVLAVVLASQYLHLHRNLSRLVSEEIFADGSRFHRCFGVLWLVYPDGHFEDTPYCPTCKPRQPLIVRDEGLVSVLRCPSCKEEMSLHEDGSGIGLSLAITYLAQQCSGVDEVKQTFYAELNRLRALYPSASHEYILQRVMAAKPFRLLPRGEAKALLARFHDPALLIAFISSHMDYYRPLLVRRRR